ncbi:MAG TPA: hypothetical protein VJZ91_17725 [Blastocatellia bacterium]|nr:hypothetical protein [Blastocatellia bacterium]
MLCPICADEFAGSQSHCPACGFDLFPVTMDARAAAELEAVTRRPVQYVELCRPRLFPVAMLIKQVLEQHDVRVFVQGAHSLSVMPHLAMFGELRVLVDSERLDLARHVYAAYFETGDDTEFPADE